VIGRRLLIATLLLAAVAPPARAAEISIASSCEPSGSKEPCVFVSRLRYTAAPGELTFTLVGAERMRRGRLELRLRGRERRFAVARFAVGRETIRLRVRVPPRIRRLRQWRLPVEVRVVGRDENPHFTPHRERWVFDLAAAR
jgi:hypothetical protein